MADTLDRLPKPDDLTRIQRLSKCIRQPRRPFQARAAGNGFRKPRERLRSGELRWLIAAMQKLSLPRMIQWVSGNPELVVYDPIATHSPRELIRITPKHLPRATHNRKRHCAEALILFRNLVNHPDNLNLLRELGLAAPNAED